MGSCEHNLRCWNRGNKCSECRNQQKEKDNDYLHDALGVLSKGKQAFGVIKNNQGQGRVD